MRITGGKYRGKFIAARDEATLRPTTSFIREVIFNLLQHGKFQKHADYITDGEHALIGRRVMDLFCGTGALGLEALSRGAEHVIFVDQNNRVLQTTRENIRALDEGQNSTVISSSSTDLPRATAPVDVVLMDPPYQQNLSPKAMASLRDQGWLHHGTLVISEQSKLEDAVTPPGFILLEDRAHHKTRVVIYQFSDVLWQQVRASAAQVAAPSALQPIA